VSGPDPDRLAGIARWDADEVRASVAVLSRVSDGLPRWRARVEEVGRRLEDGDTWAGPAAASAVHAVLVLSGVTTAVAAGLAGSLAGCGQLTSAAAAASALARAALVTGADDAAAGAALAAEALEHAGRAGSALDAADAALTPLGAVDAFAPADFAGLAGQVLRPVGVPAPPSGGPEAVAAWWAALPALARSALVQQRPAVAGALDGLPAWARDRANRLLLARALRRPHPSATARALAAVVQAREAAGEEVQVHLFDEAGERVVLVLGDADTAAAVAVLVPGINTTPDDDLDAVTADVSRALGAARAAGAGAVAGVAWLGYRPPEAAGILLRRRARQAGPVLDAALDGLAAAREEGGRDRARTTVLAHSYGTVVTDEAADAPGRLAADAVVLLGSPGMEPDAGTLEVAEVYDAASPADPISWSGWFGQSPWADGYGAVELPVGAGTGHSEYLDAGRPTLDAVGRVVAGGGSPR
jgi:Alpha/beta hydrolase